MKLMLSLMLSILVSSQAMANSKLFGVHDFEPKNHVQQIKDVGAQVVRLPVTWHLMEEYGAGQTAQWFWDELDADVAAIEAAGAKVIIEMAQTPCWASSAPNKRCNDPKYNAYIKYPPTNVNDYANAFARLAQRYKGRVLAYEIWNEPNFTGNWLPYGARPQSINDGFNSFVDLNAAYGYVALVKATYKRLKAVDSKAMVLAGSIAGGDVAYVKEMYKAGIKGHFDALAIHPYTQTYPGRNESFGPNECPDGIKEPKFWCFKLGVERIRAAMLAEKDNKPIWFTEFGFDSNTFHNGSGRDGQAAHLQQAINLIKGWDYVPVACWYALIDQNSSKNEREYQFGLFDSYGQIKPSGQKFKELLKHTVNKPIPLTPLGATANNVPIFSWQAISGATKYTLWVNEYSSPNIPGKINKVYTPAAAKCAKGGMCTVSPGIVFSKANAEWWVTAHLKKGSVISNAANFTVTKGVQTPTPLKPTGSKNVNNPTYQWTPAAGAERYYLWVNQYGLSNVTTDDVPGIIQISLTAKEARCTAKLCQYKSPIKLSSGGAEWWVTAIAKGGERAGSLGTYFMVR